MKKTVSLILLLFFLGGCSGTQASMEPMLQLRTRMMSTGCTFDAVITADYGQEIYTFAMGCSVDAHGNLSFTVKSPETIAGITGTISKGEGALTFDDKALAFELLADGQLSPVSAPWVLATTLRGGYITACGQEEDYLRVTLEDSFRADPLTVDVWLDRDGLPVQGEILWKDRRILTMEVKSFVFT